MAQEEPQTIVVENGTEEAGAESLHEQIVALAHALWRERGCPEGSPEEDWFTAEQQVKQRSHAEVVTLLQDVQGITTRA